MRRFRTAWAFPIAGPPLANAVITTDRGVIQAVDAGGSESATANVVDLGSVAILPGLVNAHTHLELSALRNRVPAADSMPAWVRTMLLQRADRVEEDLAAVDEAIAELRAAGTALVGDVGNALTTVEPLGRSQVAAVVFHELIGFSPSDAGALARAAVGAARRAAPAPHVRLAVAAHAPYSVAPALFDAIRDERAAQRLETPLAVHLAESAEEIQFLRDGTGPWRRLLEELGAWNAAWRPPGCGAVEYLARHGWLERDVVAVHGVQLTSAELAELARRDVTLVTCPRSNAWTGAGASPVRRALDAGVRLAVGTDSLASAPDLNLFSELAALRVLAPEVPARVLLASATREGARALGWEEAYGTIEPGKRSELIAVSVPATVTTVTDVEEYLLRGVTASQVCWLEDVV